MTARTNPKAQSYNIHFRWAYYERLRARAEAEGVAISEFIRTAITYYMERKPWPPDPANQPACHGED